MWRAWQLDAGTWAVIVWLGWFTGVVASRT